MRPLRILLVAAAGIMAVAGCELDSAARTNEDPSTGAETTLDETQAARTVGLAGWVQLESGDDVGGASPSQGEDCAMAFDDIRGRVMIYGGKGDDDVNINQLWSFDVASRTWSQIVGEGPEPPPREDHTMIFDRANDALVVFGGEDGPTSNATWTFDCTSGVWEKTTHPTAPSLEGHRAFYDPIGKRMIVNGGVDQDKDLTHRTWSLNLDSDSPEFRSWSALETGEPIPAPRREHTFVYDERRHRALLFAGRTKQKSSHRNDVWALDLKTNRWSELETHGVAPDPLRQTAVGLDAEADELVVYGGEGLVRVEGDLEDYVADRIYVLDLETLRWSDRTPYPLPVYDHAGVYVPQLGGTFFYGGTDSRESKEHSTWLLKRIELGDPPPTDNPADQEPETPEDLPPADSNEATEPKEEADSKKASKSDEGSTPNENTPE